MRQEIEYHSKDTALGKMCGFIIILLLLIATACGAQTTDSNQITEDFSHYSAAPQTTVAAVSMMQSNPNNAVSGQSQEVPPQNVNPMKTEAKRELNRAGRTVLSLCIGILGTAIIVNTTNLTNGITTDYR